MATKYLHAGLATGDNDGSSAANAWQSMADALAGVAAGDNVLCYDGGSGEILVASPTAATDGAIGSYISFTATNSDFVEDGTRYVLDADSTVTHPLDMNSKDYYRFKYFDFANAVGNALKINGAFGCEFLYCNVYSGAEHGINSNIRNIFLGCKVYSNVGQGIIGRPGVFIYCSSYLNGSLGFNNSGATMLYCYSYNNGGYGMQVGETDLVMNCVSDNTLLAGYGIYNVSGGAVIMNTIVSNSIWGIENTAATANVFGVNNAFYNNSSGNIRTAARYRELITDVALSVDPYVSGATKNYNLSTPNLDLIGVEFDVDGTNKVYNTTGIPPAYSSGGGGVGRQQRLRIHGA